MAQFYMDFGYMLVSGRTRYPTQKTNTTDINIQIII